MQGYSDNDILDSTALGKRLGITGSTVLRRYKKGELPPPAFQIGADILRWRWGDVLAYLAKQNKGGDAA